MRLIKTSTAVTIFLSYVLAAVLVMLFGMNIRKDIVARSSLPGRQPVVNSTDATSGATANGSLTGGVDTTSGATVKGAPGSGVDVTSGATAVGGEDEHEDEEDEEEREEDEDDEDDEERSGTNTVFGVLSSLLNAIRLAARGI